MGCCGKGRLHRIIPRAGSPVTARPGVATPPRTGHNTDRKLLPARKGNGGLPAPVTYEYIGRSGMTVFGPVTGRRYRFGSPGSRAIVDPRDAPALRRVPHLRQVN
jgi:hypothetical protein